MRHYTYSPKYLKKLEKIEQQKPGTKLYYCCMVFSSVFVFFIAFLLVLCK